MDKYQVTSKEEIEAAIINGEAYAEFAATHPDVRFRRWKDLTYYLRKEGRIPPATDSVRLTQLLDENELKTVIEAEKEKSELAYAKKVISKLKQALVDMYDSLNSINEGFSKLPSLHIPQPEPTLSTKPKASIILPLYDLHIGHITNGPLSNYNTDTFISRCNTLTEDLLVEIRSIQQSHSLDRLVIVLGGDVVEGRTIFAGQVGESAPIEYQLCTGPEVLARNLIYPLAKKFDNVDVFSLPGNHGRLGEKNEFDKTMDNLDTVFCHILKLRCENMKNVHWQPVDSWFASFSLYDFSFLAVHGDGFRTTNGTPVYGATRYKDKMQDITNTRFDVLLAGHHHTPAEWSRGFSRICLMNNWAGTNDYASTMGLGGPPSQKVILATETNPLFAVYEFMIARKEPPIAINTVSLT